MARTPLASLLLILASLACTPSEGDDDVADETSAGDSDTSATDTGENPFDFPPVECDEMTCAEGLLCVEEGLHCDTAQTPSKFYRPPSICADVPVECLDVDEPMVDLCLVPLLCEASWSDEVTYSAGTLQCPNVAEDCGTF